MNQALYLGCCYLLGAVPTGFLAAKWLKGLDIRTVGSGNTGATNVFRTLGKGPGAVVLAIDILKGVLAVTLMTRILGPQDAYWRVLGGIAAVLGHNYTVFLGFKGGKGVATSAGVCLGLMPASALIAMVVFLVAFSISRMVSVGSLLSAAALPLAACYDGESGPQPPAPGQFFWLAMVLAAFVWVRHLPNIRRILAGTENRFGKR